MKTKGDSVTRGMAMERMTECPLCKGQGCVICHETGVVKQRNLDRARNTSVQDSLWRRMFGPRCFNCGRQLNKGTFLSVRFCSDDCRDEHSRTEI